jgi:NAD(P)-dependent dehydrogenase (short-subunit alcohol dehydrogenase family)
MFLKPSSTNDRKEIRSYYQHRFHCCKSLSNGNVYCATKHAVDALNQGMRMDLNPFGIRVGAIHPEWCRLNLVKCALKEIRIEPKSISRVHALTTRRYRRHHSLCGIETVSYQRFSSNAQASSTIIKIRIFILLLLIVP